MTYEYPAEDFRQRAAEDREENERLRAALRMLLTECEASGNADAKDYGWPEAIAAARAALTDFR